MRSRTTGNRQQGVMLIEALIGILIFSIGILAMVGLQATSIGYVADAKYRADASFLANQIIAQMWVDQTNMATYAYPSGTAPALTSWVARVNSDLPGTVTNPPTIQVVPSSNPINPSAYSVTVTIQWLPPRATAAHSYTATAQISSS